MNKILIVDDDRLVRLSIKERLKDYGFSAIEATSGNEALKIFQQDNSPLVLLDLKMPGIDGIETLKELKKIDPDVIVIIITAHGDIQTAVEAVKIGAYDFITKPPDYGRLVLTLQRAAERFELNQKVKHLSSDVETSLEYMLGRSGAIRKVIQQINQIARSDFSLIIQGETGTGKSFIARLIHNLSKRKKGPFVTVDIGTIPETLVESELFGYEKGAFTGAVKKKAGFFEIAHGGTIFIDELQNLSTYVQGKLLAAVEERIIYPLGGARAVKTDVRIIGATNRDIIKAVKEKKEFREDLFYRLSEFMICLPPLRERTEDIPFLAEKFVRNTSDDLNKRIRGISQDALKVLEGYSWPGNIRELKNVIRRTVLLANEEIIRPEHIDFLIENEDAPVGNGTSSALQEAPIMSLKEAEKITIKKALDASGGNRTRAASILQVSYMTLLRKIKEFDMSV